MQTGEQLLIETTDPLAAIDIPAFLAESGHRLIRVERLDTGHRFLAECGSPASPQDFQA